MTRAAPEAAVLRSLRLGLGGRPDTLVWRNHVGVARYPSGAPVPYGLCVGAADLIGIRTVTIGLEHVGLQLGQFLAVEAKSPRGRLSPEQRRFLDLVQARGGLAVEARSMEDVLAYL